MRKDLKCVVVGDAAVGKTSLLSAITLRDSSALSSSAEQQFKKRVILGEDGEGQQMVVDMQLIDTAGEDDTRGAAHYPSADVFLVCFSIISPSSFESITSRWAPSIRRVNSNAPIILVGNKVDLRYDKGMLERLAERGLIPVTEKQGRELQRDIEAREYFEISTSELEVLDLLVTEVVREAVGKGKGKREGDSGKKRKQKNTTGEPRKKGKKNRCIIS